MNDTPITEAPAQEAAETEVRTTLEDWCAGKSHTDKRVEMLGAFHHVESKAKRTRDLPSAYAARYEAFLTAPA